jgi:hypothetical protein
MCGSSWEEDNKALHKYISSQTANTEDVEDIVNKFSDALMMACNKSFKIGRTYMKTNKHNGALVDRRPNNSEEMSKHFQKEIPKDKNQ